MLAEKIIYSNTQCSLGESPVWLMQRQSFLWLDILGRTVFEKKFNSAEKRYDQKWDLEYTPTRIIPDTGGSDRAWIIADNGIHRFDLETGQDCLTAELDLPDTHRPNDGSAGPNGNIYFGTMQWEPEGKFGKLYEFRTDGALNELNINIGIPNTFAWLDSSQVAISDSLYHRIDRYKADGNSFHFVDNIYDFSDQGGEPDGGAVDINGNLWVALWEMGQIVCIDPDEKIIIERIALPVRRPSCCCFGGPGLTSLFITSAVQDKTGKDDYDGKSFLVKMGIPGMAVGGFSLCR